MQAEGIYRGPVKDWGIAKASTGKFQHFLLVEIRETAKDDANISEGFEEVEKPFLRKIFKAMTPRTRDWLLSDLRSLGYDRKSLTATSIQRGNDDSFDFAGKLAVVECTHEEYKGLPKERWQITTRKGSVKLTGEDISQLDQMFSEGADLDGYDPFAESTSPTAAEVPPKKGKKGKAAEVSVP